MKNRRQWSAVTGAKAKGELTINDTGGKAAADVI